MFSSERTFNIYQQDDVPLKKRRKFSTKDCEECKICSDNVFEICHPHISSLDILTNSPNIKSNPNNIFCPMCKRSHSRYPGLEEHSDLNLQTNKSGSIYRRPVVMGSSDFHNLWKAKSYLPDTHIDFDCIIGGRIHDSHASFILQYQNQITSPLNLILVCGINNIPTSDSSRAIITQFKAFIQTFREHSELNRLFICPILYAPKFCDNRLLPTTNHLLKILEVNRWIKEFNRTETGIQWDLSRTGVQEVPTSVDQGVLHDYRKWREPNWRKMLHLNPEAKEEVALRVLETFTEMEKL